jgi:hypothetical protein
MRWYAFRLWVWDVVRLRFGDYHWEGRNRRLYYRRREQYQGAESQGR